MRKKTQDDIPSSPEVTDRILLGKVVITESCPRCGARWSYPVGDTLTCGECYTEFK